MDRRKSLKLIAASAIAAPVVAAGCKTEESKKKETPPAENKFSLDRSPDELKYENSLLAKDKFFTEQEMATITLLADIIIPKDGVSGSASDARVPDFIEFIVKDMPSHQTSVRGGLRWLDVECLKRFNHSFRDCTHDQQISVVDDIAYPKKAKPAMSQGVKFFSEMRNLVATGFYTSEMGVKDIGYAGNNPTQWNGVPADVLRQYNVSYTEKELKECVSFDK